MVPPFASAAMSALPDDDNRMVIASDWDGTLIDIGATNFDLLEFLSDAHRAGHRVIITSTLAMSKIKDLFDLTIELGRMRGYDLIDAKDFEMMGKADFLLQNLDVDFAFDNEPIASQHIPYCDPAVEIRVGRGFTLSQPLESLRKLCGMPAKATAEASEGPQLSL